MASGKTHDIINLMAFPVAVYYLKPDSFLGFFTGYMLGTFFLSPDNDLFHSKPNKRWKVLRYLWFPYTKLFSHRGISHLPAIGLTIKLVYIFAIFFMLFLIIYTAVYLSGIKTDFFISILSYGFLKKVLFSPFCVSFFVGLFLSEIVHILTDLVYSTLKKFPFIKKLFLS